MDLINLVPKSDTVEVKIKHPGTLEVLKNDDGSDMTITVYAPHAKQHKKVIHDLANKRIKASQKKNAKEITIEDLEEATLETLARVTKEWNITYNGEKPALTEAKAREVYEKVFWIKAQVERDVDESLDFLRA